MNNGGIKPEFHYLKLALPLQPRSSEAQDYTNTLGFWKRGLDWTFKNKAKGNQVQPKPSAASVSARWRSREADVGEWKRLREGEEGPSTSFLCKLSSFIIKTQVT